MRPQEIMLNKTEKWPIFILERAHNTLVPKRLGPRTKSFLKNKHLKIEEEAYNTIQFYV